ncbi:hydrolase [Saccharospirillum sp. MSK14-1]|uniref:lipocalin-like domain-containing protein n=1 Tax=Saccharospirillum sp. MSK14-1 TaxID=1897632 RepID=UPI000D36C5C7|nr:lipocalin-like domain-containing protein [Saccharospirillum sp. MSK14-1]PTY37207.1 hydrolase [Saccharospirillum sp. MSK14-1]
MRYARLLIIALISHAVADDYQLLRADPSGYPRAVPNPAIEFPTDHLPHPDFRIEWWYLTANLTDADGESWGLQWTLFRQAMTPNADPGGWASKQVWMAHAALSTPTGHRYAERFARGGIGQAGVALNDTGDFNAWLDDWQWTGTAGSLFPGTLDLAFDAINLDITLNSTTPWVLQGEAGYHQKSDLGQASHYYSQPHIQIDGELTVDGETFTVSGPGWLDREWSSQPLAPNQPGWDWFSLHLNDGSALMVYQLRNDNGEPWINGTWVDADGRSQSLERGAIELTAESFTTLTLPTGEQKTLPLDWTLRLPDRNHSWRITALRPDSWLSTLFPYWEGPVVAQSQNPATPGGMGYLELTGY